MLKRHIKRGEALYIYGGHGRPLGGAMIFLKTATTSRHFTVQRLRGLHESVFFFRFVEPEPLPTIYCSRMMYLLCSTYSVRLQFRTDAWRIPSSSPPKCNSMYYYEGIQWLCVYNWDLRMALQSILQSPWYMRYYFCLVLSLENLGVGGEINAEGKILT